MPFLFPRPQLKQKVPDPPGNLANGAVYIFEPEVIDKIKALPSGLKDLSTQIIPNYIDRIQTFFHDGYHRDIGNIQSLQKAVDSIQNF